MKPLCALLIAVLAAPSFAAKAPDWLEALATDPLPQYNESVPAAVLLNEQKVEVRIDGQVTTTTRFAMKILTREGRSHAVARIPYLTNGGNARDLDAWIIHPSGTVQTFGRRQTLGVPIVGNDIYNEVRVKVINAAGNADAGAVFGFEGRKVERGVLAQFEWQFQSRLPTLSSRYELTLPNGWGAETVTWNHPPIDPHRSGSTWSWELRELEPIPEEPAAPALTSLSPRLAVTILTPENTKTPIRGFRTWTDVSEWLSELSDPQAEADAAIIAKARELTRGASSEFERLEAIARYAQSIRYVSIQTGLLRGGGYTPHPAADVFANSYGDCKDKATLLRAMLKAVGVESWPLVIYAGDRDYVQPDWPSPHPFNHVILAIQVSDQIQFDAVVEHPRLGRLLLFDPTDEYTPLGWLPIAEQGSNALLVAGPEGMMLRTPPPNSASNRTEMTLEVRLSDTGDAEVIVDRRYWGEAAVRNQQASEIASSSDYEKGIEQWIGSSVSAAIVKSIERLELGPAEFQLRIGFSAPRYARQVQPDLMTFRPVMLESWSLPPYQEVTRKLPVVVEVGSYAHQVEVQLPDGFHVEDLPADVELVSPFGSWNASGSVSDGTLVLRSHLELRSVTLPPERYDEIREFFSSVAASATPAVILTR